jgi:hypothetical protein
VAHGLGDKGANAAILGALGLLTPDRAAVLIEGIIAATAAISLATCADLLARAFAALPQKDLAGAAMVLIDALPGDPGRAPPRDPWRRGPGVQSAFVVDLFTALGSIDSPLAERAADHILAWPETYGLDRVLVPAVRQMTGPGKTEGRAVQRLRSACVVHLRARVAETLEAPRDWKRPSAVGCSCPHCTELSGFLADPARKTWIFKAKQADRSHVETTIRNAHSDLDVTTERRGSPHSLICSKNQASYERRVKQRKEDLADLERLEG